MHRAEVPRLERGSNRGEPTPSTSASPCGSVSAPPPRGVYDDARSLRGLRQKEGRSTPKTIRVSSQRPHDTACTGQTTRTRRQRQWQVLGRTDKKHHDKNDAGSPRARLVERRPQEGGKKRRGSVLPPKTVPRPTTRIRIIRRRRPITVRTPTHTRGRAKESRQGMAVAATTTTKTIGALGRPQTRSFRALGDGRRRDRAGKGVWVGVEGGWGRRSSELGRRADNMQSTFLLFLLFFFLWGEGEGGVACNGISNTSGKPLAWRPAEPA